MMLFRIGMALLSGLMILLSFPKWNLGILAWISLVPMLAASQGFNFKKSFLIGWLTGLTAFCGILYWIVPTFQAAEVSIVVALLSTFLLSSYIGLFYGLFTALSQTVFPIYQKLLAEKGWDRFSEFVFLVFSASLWVFLEYIRGFLFTGFPWGILGYSQWQYLPVIQISEWTGVYGVSFLIVFVNLFLFHSLKIWREQKSSESNRPPYKFIFIRTFCLLILFSLLITTGLWSSRDTLTVAKTHLHVAILQGNIDQYKKWNAQYVREIITAYKELSEKVSMLNSVDKSADLQSPNHSLIVWPETAAPGWIPQDAVLFKWIEKTVQKTGSYNLIGAANQENDKNHNSAFLFSPDGKMIGRYDKMHLVPFGEFVPLQDLLGRWIPVLNLLGGFHSGEKLKILELPGIKLGTGICYESIFPELIREQARQGAEVLINLTNDGWYLDTAALEQHLSMNVFRAVENRRYLVRSANTGISAIIHPNGTLIKNSKLNEKIYLTDTVVPLRKKTLYTKYGDWFALWCAVISIVGIHFSLKVLIQSQRSNPNENH